jgi:outer membrane protein TolC
MRSFLPAALCLMALSFAFDASAQAQPTQSAPEARAYTLADCLKLAQRNYPRVLEARARLAKMRAQLDEAHTAPFSEFRLTTGLSMAPTVRGTDLFSPNTDVSLTSDMGLAWEFGVEGALPLWTFGKITNLWDAAEAQIVVGTHEVRKAQEDVKLTVRRAFYGILLARDSLDLIRDAARRIDTYVERLAKRVAEGDGDDIELHKIRMYRAELDARESQARKEERSAVAGLRFLTGVRGAFDVPNEPLRRSRHTLAPLAHYLAAAQLFRPEVNMARAGLAAREAQLRLARSRYYPDIGLGLSWRWRQAPQVTDQRNPFVRDDGNFMGYGAALVLRHKLDFLPQAARAAQAAADLEEMRATHQYALGGIGVEVEQAFEEALDAERRLAAQTEALRQARQWLIKVQQGIEVGTFDDEEIIDPAREYAMRRFSQMSAIFDYNVALAKLAQATGWEAVLAD